MVVCQEKNIKEIKRMSVINSFQYNLYLVFFFLRFGLDDFFCQVVFLQVQMIFLWYDLDFRSFRGFEFLNIFFQLGCGCCNCLFVVKIGYVNMDRGF